MASKKTLKDVLEKLSSSKVKERTDGLAALRSVLERDSSIKQVNESGSKTWLIIFQHVFTIVLNEKATCIKKTTKNLSSGTAAQTRLRVAAETVRWLVERCLSKLNRKAVQVILVHLLQTIAHDGWLFDPVALHYVKTIRCIVSYPPHLEHLESDLWIRILEIAWNVVLGDPLRRPLDSGADSEDFTEDIDMISADEGDNDDDDGGDDDDDDDEGARSPQKRRKRADDDDDVHTSPQKKRQRSTSVMPAPATRATPFSSAIHAVSPEQVECTALLAVLLGHSSAPLLSGDPNGHEALATQLLERHRRFIDMYRTDTSLHQDFLLALSATLSRLALNKRADVTYFARRAWDGILSMWGLKNKSLKEHLVVIFRTLFPFYTSANPINSKDPPFDYSGGLANLWEVLDQEVDQRRSFDGLSLDCLRLQLHQSLNAIEYEFNGAFEARTFQHGTNFDATQAFTWSILELQADCVSELVASSETAHKVRTGMAKRGMKRAKLEDPISALIDSVQVSNNPATRSFHLQTVLFFVDRHWPHVHEDLRKRITQPLTQFISIDNPSVQSWTFLCLAAVAEHQASAKTDEPGSWDHLWAHAMRRINTPLVSRAACHAAHVLLSFSSRVLSSQPVLHEIEAFAKDLDVQGPPYPYESVCMLVGSCLRVASQDMRLFRMHIEEKVLSWLSDAWTHGEALAMKGAGRKRIARPFVSDVLDLLETVCMLPKHSSLVCRGLLPDSPIARQTIDAGQTSVIRMLLLEARLPSFPRLDPQVAASLTAQRTASSPRSNEFIAPSSRERKVSTSMLKFLETLQIAVDSPSDGGVYLTSERCRQLVDTAILAITFEASLTVNGMKSNMRVLQAASRLIMVVLPVLSAKGWSREEQATVLLGFEPLVSDGEEQQDDGWSGLIKPAAGIGIRREAFAQFADLTNERREQKMKLRRELQRIIWQMPEIQDMLADVMRCMKSILRSLITKLAGDTGSKVAIDVDDKDGFAPTKSAFLLAQASDVKEADIGSPAYHVMAACMLFIATGPGLQSTSNEPTRDRELTDILLDADGDEFLLLAPAYLFNVRRKNLMITSTALDNLLVKVESLLKQHTYAHNETLQQIVISLLDATMELWVQRGTDLETMSKVQDIFHWLGESLEGRTMRSWKVRDSFTAFLSRYIVLDPQETVWFEQYSQDSSDDDEDEIPTSPFALLPALNQDVDIRVRFRTTKAMAALFLAPNRHGYDVHDVYNSIRPNLCSQLENYEHMLTRFLALTNVAIASAAIARGPYWHLIETCIPVTWYNHHVAAMLEGLATRMSLPKRSDLFSIYASHITGNICDYDASVDFLLCIDPAVLGFEDRKALARACFRPFAQRHAHCPDLPARTIETARRRLASHCNLLDKDVIVGLQEVFADILAYELVWCIKYSVQDIDKHLAHCFDFWSHNLFTVDNIRQSLDGVFVAILCILQDQDVGYDSPISAVLERLYPNENYQTFFRELTAYRVLPGGPQTFLPNAPAEDSAIILKAIEWVKAKAGGGTITAATSYHIFRQVVALIHNQPLVNEQLRLINGLCLWIALNSQHFRGPIFLHAVIHSSSILLAQYDVSRAAQSILAWAFKQFKSDFKPRFADVRLTDVFVWVASLAMRYSASSDSDEAVLGQDLLQFVEEQMLTLLKRPYLKDQCIRALLSWPREPHIIELENIRRKTNIAVLTDVLDDPRVVANKFRVVRRLYDSSHHDYPAARFSRVDFWRLKECIPLRGQLEIEDVDAFSSLLLKYSGRIYGFGTDPLSAQTTRPAEARVRKKHSSNAPDMHEIETPERVILEHLLCILDANDPSRVQAAYSVLRHVSSIRQPKLSEWSQEYSLEMNYYYASSRPAVSRPPFNLEDLDSLIDLAKEYRPWISSMTSAFCDAIGQDRPFFAQLPPIMHSDPDFAGLVLPTVVHTLLRLRSNNQVGSSSSSARVLLSRYFTAVLCSPTSDVFRHRAIVKVVLHLRHFYPANHNKDYLAFDKWLDINYMLLSRSAIRCGAYTTALLFHELAFEYARDDIPSTDTEEILFEIYSHIDEPDGFYGIQTHDFHRFLVKRFHHEQQWDKALMFHGAALEARNQDPIAAAGVLHSLHSVGFNNLALNVQASSSADLSGTPDMSYDLGWRTQTWDLPDDPGTSQEAGHALYRTLRAVHRERDLASIESVITAALEDVMDRLRTLGDEDLIGIRGAAQSLLCLSQVKRWQEVGVQSDLAQRRLNSAHWKDFVQINPELDFQLLESIMATRMSLLSSTRQKEQRQQIGDTVSAFSASIMDVEKQCLMRVSEAARASNHLQIALNSVIRARTLEKQPTSSLSQEFANVLWDQREHHIAIQTLKDVTNRYYFVDGQEGAASSEKALLLSRLGSWSAEACMQKPMNIWEDYFNPAAQIITAPGYQVDSSTAKIFHECAVFADRQYHALSRSPDTVRKKVYVDRKVNEIREIDSQVKRGNHEARSLLLKAQRQLKVDQENYELHIKALRTFLQQAAGMYARCLESSDAYDDDAHIRLVSLWYANFDDSQLASALAPAIERIPSSKFVFLSHQLTSRLAKHDVEPSDSRSRKGKSSSLESAAASQEVLQKLVHRMCIEHPFHTIYQLFPLRPAGDGAIVRRRQSQRLEASQPQSQRDRAAAAGDLFAQLRQGPSARRVRDVETFCQECLEWAKYSVKALVKAHQHVKEHSAAGKTKLIDEKFFVNLRVPVPTVNTPIDPTMNYRDCIWVKSYGSHFKTAGGVNLPKIHDCFGSDGKTYTQLFKGEGDDDLRQDAVMEQVFALVDIALHRDRDTSRRNLSIRRYTVLPLAEQAGIIEFVSNTKPLADWINSAHHKYRPNDVTTHEMSKMMAEARNKYERSHPGSVESKMLEWWHKATARLQPVMRHWFTEAQKAPMSWFAMRLNYTRSVATTSIVGHILGLGDRHTRNILLDVATGEIVHIDLGIAFEQGKLLPVPELVPFRMTRDMVDGMGTAGVRGVFQRCAEETLRVLREDSEVILTVLEVFKYDPLHSWTASDMKMNRAQDQQQQQQQQTVVPTVTGIGIDMNSGSADEAADRALSAVARKLDRSLSVEYTVNDLIAEATDPANLCCMYHGWSPYL